MALRLAKSILRKNLIDYLPIGKNMEITEIEVADRMAGKTIVDLDLRRRLFAECHRDPPRGADRDGCASGLPPVSGRHDHRDRKRRKCDTLCG